MSGEGVSVSDEFVCLGENSSGLRVSDIFEVSTDEVPHLRHSARPFKAQEYSPGPFRSEGGRLYVVR